MDTRPVPVRARETGIGSTSSIVPRESRTGTAGQAQEFRTVAPHPARRNALVLLLLVFLCQFVLPVTAQGPVERVVLTEVNSTDFPAVTLRFRALDAAGRHVPGIQRNQISIQDGETAATAESPTEEAAPLSVHFVIETGVSLDDRGWAAAQEAVRAFGSHMGGNTTAAVSYVNGRELASLVAPTTDANAITGVDSPNPSGSALAVAMPALTGLLEEMGRQSPGQAQAVVFITRQLEFYSDDAYATLVARAREAGIPIYTALLRSVVRPRAAGSSNGTPTPPPQDERVESLAADTGGVFTLMAEDPARMTDAYGDLAARGRQYAVVYRVGDNVGGARNVTLSLNDGTRTLTSNSISYEFGIVPPQVRITSPTNGGTVERQMPAEDGTKLSQPIQITATIDFGLNPNRRVESAELLVDGVTTMTVEREELVLQTTADGNIQLDLFWDMADMVEVGERPYNLAVKVVDELGVPSASELSTVTVRVTPGDVVIVDGTPIAGTATTELPATPIPCLSPSPLCERVERPIRANPVAAISILVAFLALLLLALMWINRGKAPVQRVTQTVRRGLDRITNRYRRSEVRAYLELLAGDGDMGHRYEIYGDTPIGRSRQNAELLFQAEAENSPISRLHCTITDEEDHFMIRDEDSANGTYLNGERLTPIVPHRLKDGDILELARVERGGVRLRFVAATAEDTVPPPNVGYTFVDGQLGGQPDGQPVDQTRGRF
ncbi:MAG: FHA domain-containing protein [Candidatus Promineofilum sp.]|nr:FHA domain-containing protein [Promineifilum sp.]